MSDLLPCPFCGFDTCIAHPNSLSVVQLARVSCPNCETSGPEVPDLQGAIAAWNRRATPAPVAPSDLVERLRTFPLFTSLDKTRWYRQDALEPLTQEAADLIERQQRVIAAADAIVAAAVNVVEVKGRYHTEQAFKALIAAVNARAYDKARNTVSDTSVSNER